MRTPGQREPGRADLLAPQRPEPRHLRNQPTGWCRTAPPTRWALVPSPPPASRRRLRKARSSTPSARRRAARRAAPPFDPSWNRLRAPRRRRALLPHRQAVGGPVEDDAALVNEFLRLGVPRLRQRRPCALAPGGRACWRSGRWRRVRARRRGRRAVAAAERLTPRGRPAGGPHRWEPLLYAAYTRARAGEAPGRPWTLEVSRYRDGGLPVGGAALAAPRPDRRVQGVERATRRRTSARGCAGDAAEAGADPADDLQLLINTAGNAYLELLLRHGFGRVDRRPRGTPTWRRAQPTQQELAQDAASSGPSSTTTPSAREPARSRAVSVQTSTGTEPATRLAGRRKLTRAWP